MNCEEEVMEVLKTRLKARKGKQVDKALCQRGKV